MYAYIPAKGLARARQFYENAGPSKANQAFWPVEDIEGCIMAAIQNR